MSTVILCNMNYYKLRGLVKSEILAFLKTKPDHEWPEFKRGLLHRFDIGEVTIRRLLAIYNVRETPEGGLENVAVLNGTVRATQPGEQTTPTEHSPVP